MTDTELQRIVLQKFYDERKSGKDYRPKPDDFDIEIDDDEISSIELLLYQKEFIKGIYQPYDSGNYSFCPKQITHKGIAFIENHSNEASVNQIINYNIFGANQFQIGNDNELNIYKKKK